MEDTGISVELALNYLAAGLSVLPARKAEKHPAIGAWKTWSERLPSEYEVKAWFGNHPDGVCIVTGRASGHLECMDFDNHGELFDSWKKSIDPALYSRLVVEQTPSGGYHVVYRCVDTISGNLKLARGDRCAKIATLIETRGEGGLFLCSPTAGYSVTQGEFAHIPTLTTGEREQLLAAARALNEVQEAAHVGAGTARPESSPYHAGESDGAHVGANLGDTCDFATRPGDDFSDRGEIRPILEAHGWQFLGQKPDGNELWRRPGKTSGGHSATFDGHVFYVFSSNATPFDSERGYSKFQVYAMLECASDYTRAAKELLSKGYGQTMPDQPVDFSGLNTAVGDGTPGVRALPDGQTPSAPPFLTLGELVEKFPKMRPALIHGFLRRGETMNIIAPPKTGKSWLVTDLALSVATGTPWFGFPCEKGRVLIIDNELHCETSANRIPKVVEARGFDLAKVRNDICIDNQRGRLGNIEDLANKIEILKPYGFKLIIIDAFYRAMPKGTDENDNGTVAGIYNLIDRYAAALDCAFVLIHHTSKGNQSLKSVTDVGAGAGSQSRASDAHVILRRHKEDGVVVMESVVRSFPSVRPVCLRWNWPVWNRDDALNPEELDGKKEEHNGSNDPEPSTLAERLVELVDNEHPMSKGVFISKVRTSYGIMEKTARLAVDIAIENNLIKCCRLKDQPRGAQATKFVTLPDAQTD